MAMDINARLQLAEQRGVDIRALSTKKFSRSLRHLAHASQNRYKGIEKLFLLFLREVKNYSEAEIEKMIRDGGTLPDSDMLKAFLIFYATTTKGRLGDRPTANTCENIFHKLSGHLSRITGKAMPQAVIDDIQGFIQSELPKWGVEDVKQEKDYADNVILEVLLEQHWCWDAGYKTFGSQIVQTAFGLHLMFFSVGRLGSFLRSSDYPKLGLQYRHIKLWLDQKPNGEVFFRARVDQDSMKGRKESHHVLKTTMHEEDKFGDCPLLLLIALAFADDAFLGISTPEELFAISPKNKDSVRTIHWKPEKMGEFILKQPRGDNVCLSDTTFRELLRATANRAGYTKPFKMYNIRRFGANRLGDTISPDRRRQIMGQSSEYEYQKSYQSDLACVDIQGIILRNRQDPTLDFSKLLRTERGIKPPTHLPSAIEMDIREKLLNFEQGSTEQYNARRKLRRQAWTEFLKEWHAKNAENDESALKGSSALIPDSIELMGDLNMSETESRILLERYNINNQILTEAFKADKFNMRDNNGVVLKLLIQLAKTKKYSDEYYYPDEAPIRTFGSESNEYHCSICRKDITNMTPLYRPIHIHACAERSVQLPYPEPNPQYCHRCNIWFPKRDDYQEHCRRHFVELDMFCGLRTAGRTVIVAGRCPFCLSDESPDIPWDLRVCQFTESSDFKKHLSEHLADHLRVNSSPCPHPLCDQDESYSIDVLLRHFADAHGITQALDFCLSATQSKSSIPTLSMAQHRMETFSPLSVRKPQNNSRTPTDCNVVNDIGHESSLKQAYSVPIQAFQNIIDEQHGDVHAQQQITTRQMQLLNTTTMHYDCTTPPALDRSSNPLLETPPMRDTATSPTDYTNLSAAIPFEPTISEERTPHMHSNSLPPMTTRKRRLPSQPIPPVTRQRAKLMAADYESRTKRTRKK